MTLQSLARDYLTSAGFRILEERSDCLVADKLFWQERDTWIVWTIPQEKEPGTYESALRSSISSIRPNYPDAKAYVLASSRSGFSRDFLQTLAELKIKFLVPIWFFDAPFKVEEAPKAVSAIGDIRSLAVSQKRVPQPFFLEDQCDEAQEDLFEQLRAELTKPDGASVRIIVGRAGIGKSFLFRALFANLYGEFLAAKGQQRAMPRPIPLLPEHLRETYGLRTEALIENFLRTDVAAPVARKTFEWLLMNGFATWMLDGLDELYAGDPDFFGYLFDLVASHDSKAQITIFCRDSLLTTSDAFAEFRDVCAGTTAMKIYHLSQWERRSKRQFAWLALEGRLPKPGEQDFGKVNTFLTSIDRSPTLNSLCSLPFNCDLLLKQHQAGTLQEFSDDVALLNFVIDQMVEREVKKGLVSPQFFESNGLHEWLEQIAVDYVEGQRYINGDQAMEYGQLVLRTDLDEKKRRDTLTSLLQFPLFRAGEKTGLIAFTHDMIAETLAARKYMRSLLSG
jgi:hypothetical protein